MGVQRAETEPESGTALPAENDWMGAAPTEEPEVDTFTPAGSGMSGKAKLLAGVLILLALGWTGFFIWSVAQTGVPGTAELPAFIAAGSAPLILIGLVWLMFGRTGRRETERFTRTVTLLRAESAALDDILQIVTQRLEDNYARLTGEAAKLMSLGDEASDRLGRVTHYLSKESATLDKKAEQLETAANAARVDIGVLLHDLPRAEEQARAVAEAMKDAGFTAHAETGQLESQLSALVARGREADEVVGGAAQRLAAHLARIQSSTVTAAAQLDQAANSMTAAVDDSMTRTAEAVDAARTSLEAQGQAILAMVEQSRAALEQAGEASGRNLAQRLESIGGQIETLGNQLAAQDAASLALVGGLASALAELDERFASLGRNGTASSETLSGAIETVRTGVQQLSTDIEGGQTRTSDLIERTQRMAEALAGVTRQLQDDVSPSFTDVEIRAGQARGAAEELAPIVEAVQVAACDAASQASAAETSIARQRDALDQLLAKLRENVAGAEEQLRALGEAAEGADAAAGKIAADTGPELVEALLRVREAAAQAAERARETIAAVIPASAAELGEASRRAISDAIAATVEQQLGELGALSERAIETARAASERLTRQMLTIGESAALVDARIDAARQAREEHDSESFPRRVALLMESLNSTAIDVAKILSNEVTDSEWTAYLKGDRGVFTRRAVRLLDNAEAREIVQHYENDAEFRDQVNRYVHDFEAMLRRVLGDRDGNMLGVTILSSDMGKLYVALAQAIERLRN